MSDFTGLAGVTRTLTRLLEDRMREPVTVTAARPDTTPPDLSGPRLNLFLYRVAECGALRNQDLPGAGTPMGYGRPPLSLDLDFLLYAEASDPSDDAAVHRITGDAMLVLHEVSIIPPDLLRTAPPGDPVLDASLLGEVEHLRISLASLTADDLARIWSATRVPYRLSAAYSVTVVQLESTLPRRLPRPVGEPPDAGPRVFAITIDRPTLSSITVIRVGDTDESPVPYARVGDTIVLRGSGFVAGSRVLVGETDVTSGVVSADSSAGMLQVVLPDAAAMGAGPHAVQVVRDVEVGDPPVATPAMRSNVLPLVIVPHVTGLAPPSGPDPTAVTLQGTRLSSGSAPSYVIVGDRAFALAAGPSVSDTEVQVEVGGLPPGVYPVSVRVAGAESIDAATFEVTP